MTTIQRREGASRLPFASSLHPILQRLYATRGVTTQTDIECSLQHLQKPTELQGLDAALQLLEKAIRAQSHIMIVGDFDADGATSVALSVLALRALGAGNVDYLVPNRFEYGYGLSPEIVAVAQQRHPDMIITVDNGIASVAGVAAAKAAGIDVIITDHHLPGAELPNADAIINPNQVGCRFPSKALAGVGVIFYVMSALRTHLIAQDWFTHAKLPVPNMADLLDLVALGTVADVVPLDRNNRILVEHGMRRIRAGKCRPGISALLEVAKRRREVVVASDLGFAVGPRLNAAGRMDDIAIGIECLLAEQSNHAKALAVQLDQLNYERRQVEAGMQKEALQILGGLNITPEQLPWGVCLYQKDWHQGVIGILASRIKERLHRPVIVFAPGEGNTLKGSARSIPGLHIRDALDAVASQHPELISKFGGHAMAAGLSLDAEHLKAFETAFDQVVRDVLDPKDLEGSLITDGPLPAECITVEFAQQLRHSGPWGQAFPEPLFDDKFELLEQRLVAEKHLKMVLTVPGSNRVIDAIAFNVDVQQWPNADVSQIRVVYKLDVNHFRGVDSAQLLVEYLEPTAI